MEISLNEFLFAFGLTLLAGLSTGIGSLLAFFTKKNQYKVFIWSLGFFSRSNDLCLFCRDFPQS